MAYVVPFFTYFTILSNILVAVVLFTEARAIFMSKPLPKRLDRARGTAVFCIVVTGVVYALFLRGPGGMGAVPDSIPWINAIFHYIMPSVMFLDWLLFPTKKPAPWYSILKWILITVVYFIYVELVGFFTKAYPYFFLDPTKLHGYLNVTRASLTFIPFFAVFGFVIVLVNHLRIGIETRLRKITLGNRA